MTGSLPQWGGENRNAILWDIVEAVVDTTETADGGPANLGNPKFVIPPSLWDPDKHRPI